MLDDVRLSVTEAILPILDFTLRLIQTILIWMTFAYMSHHLSCDFMLTTVLN